jgi:DNA-binding transcriptional ArsR family regulator
VRKALSHPLRARILDVLREREASPRELAEELDAPLGVTAYHVRRLADLGLIALVRETHRRGSIEHHYLAAESPGG